ncbi:hypothetical protein [Oceanobacillus jeddahense]|uniref:DUF4271 domain-containing protein n=1 Tax=Oceanobacillus jeddahense TaxID=1462527 RepID=A0ABY5JV69_9BACI|nr:hypothetical protein [Oceanobacillus jeddahense]UUI03357.1 hypothetical protein NP439_01150 [Oceanobacillus jeddahense]
MEKDDKQQEENVEEEYSKSASEGGETVEPGAEEETQQPGSETNEVNTPTQQQAEGLNETNQEEKTKNSQFDFQESFNEIKGIALDAVLRPNTLIHSSRAIKVETSLIIFALLAVLVSVCHYLFYRYGFDGLFYFLGDINFTFVLKTFVSWLITFAIGYFSLYILLKQFGNKTMEHKDLLTKYVIVNIPFVLVFCLVTLFFGFVLIDLFIVTYVFSLLLFGFIHIYLFLALMEKSRYDVFWTLTAYQLVLIIASYFLVGVDFGAF